MDLITRIQNTLHDLAQFTDHTYEEGVTRLPFTCASAQAQEFLVDYFKEIGLETRIDPTGAVYGHLPGVTGEKRLYGSHYDSVRQGGAYDGAAGIVCAAEALREILNDGLRPECGITIAAWNDEEGIRFSRGFLSSRAVCEGISEEDLRSIRELGTGESLEEVIRGSGGSPEGIPALAGRIRGYSSYTEAHIEQGPVLEEQGLSVAVVTSVAGFRRYMCHVRGEANHAGSTPMRSRKDAFVSASRMIQYLYEQACGEEELTATIGSAAVSPGAVNIIPGAVDFSLEIRSSRDEKTEAFAERVLKDFDQMARDAGTSFAWEKLTETAAVAMDEGEIHILREAAERLRIPCGAMMSGAGHDAQIIGRWIPASMVFIRSIGGISHQPAERSEPADLALASMILKEHMLHRR